MSVDDGKQVVMKGVTHGACDYLIKPIRIEELKNIWQHVVRKRKNEWKELEQSVSVEGGSRHRFHKQSEDADYTSSTVEGGGNGKGLKRRKDEEHELEERDDTSTLKKARVVWSVELHQQFVAAVNQLGLGGKSPLPRLQACVSFKNGRGTAVQKILLTMCHLKGLCAALCFPYFSFSILRNNVKLN